jgi:cell division transport system ATP-binding protein
MTDPDAAAPIIRLNRVHHAYGRHQALADLSFEVAKNEWVFITGPSGAGKSTLLKLLYFGAKASAGEVFIDGENPARLPPYRIPLLRRKCGVIFQDYKLIPGRSVFANVALVLEAAGHRRRLIPQKVRSVLRRVGMEAHAQSLPPRLSGGEQQRVAVARAIVGDPKSSWPMNPPAAWTRCPPKRWWISCARPTSAAPPSWWPPTTSGSSARSGGACWCWSRAG